MQLAINIIIFFLGFSIATVVALRPRKARHDIDKFTSNLRHVTNGLTGGPYLDVKQPQQQPDTERESVVMEEGISNLLTKDQVEQQFDMSTWQRLAYEDFKTTILAKGAGLRTFPCVYATAGYRSNDHRYVFLHSSDPSEPRNIRHLAPALRAYLRLSHTLGPNTSLVIMGAPDDGPLKSVEQYNAGFWAMLRGLRIWDSAAWPKDIPTRTDDEKWMYCFDGKPLFPVALTPAHQARWSRHASVPIVALQPKWVLDKLLATPEKRESAVGKVRKLLKEYDQIDISPDLTSYGEPGTSEVHQLCLLDENRTAECPFVDFDKGGVPPAEEEGRKEAVERNKTT